MSFLAQLATALLSVAIPAAEKASPTLKTIANVIVALEGGSSVPVNVPLLGTITLQKTA